MKLTATLGILVVLNLLASLYLNGYVFFLLGAGNSTDALYASQMLPQFFTAILTAPLRAVIVPTLSGADPERLRAGAWTFFTMTGAFAAGMAVLLALLAPYWVPALFPGFAQPVLVLTTGLARIQMLSMTFTLLSITLGCISQARGQFVRVEVCDLVGSGFAIGLQTCLLPAFGVAAVAWAMALRSVPTVVVLAAALRPAPRLPMGGFLRSMRPLMLSGLYTKSGFIVDRVLSSWAPAGALSVMNFTEKLYLAGIDLLRRIIATPLNTRMAERINAADEPGFRRVALRGTLAIAGGAALLFGLTFAAGVPVFKLIERAGRFTPENLRLFWHTLILMGGLLVFGAPLTYLMQAFYARRDVKTPTCVILISFTVGAVLKVAGFILFGVLGIAGATSLVNLLSMAVLALLLHRKTPAVLRDRLPTNHE